VRATAAVAVLLAALAPAPSAAFAQGRGGRGSRAAVPEPLTVIARNDLTFGALERGFRASISAHDQYRAAFFEIRGPADTPLRIELVLPANLQSPEGGLVPLTFGAADGYADVSGTWPPAGQTFNPNLPLIASLGPGGRLFLRIGATAVPQRLQPGGTYRASIFVNLYNLSS
jgi:hypothetical protein